MRLTLNCVVLLVSFVSVGCSADTEFVTSDMSSDAAGDSGDAARDTNLPDAQHQDAIADGVMDQVTLPACASAVSNGWRVCTSEQTRCAFVFDDGIGCTQACASIGRRCVQSYEDTPGTCTPNTTLPSLDCMDTGHQTDYCVCDAEGASVLDASPDMVDESIDMPGAFLLHERILEERVGFGGDVTGGAGGPVVRVTTLADSGAGSLREAVTRQGPAWIRFDVSGVIALESTLEVSSDKTIDGRGADVTLINRTLAVSNGAGNVIVLYMKIRNTGDNIDLIRFYNGGTGMWVHHCDLSEGGDGAFDATEGVTNVTISHTHIFDHDKAMLIGAGSDDGDGEGMRWTAHHNWYEDCVQRLPAIRMGRAHSFNNLFQWRSGTAFSVNIAPGQMLVEHNIFNPQTTVGHKLVSQSEKRAAVKIRNNLDLPYPGDLIEYTEFMPDTVFSPSASYMYTPETADMTLMTKIQAEAGWKDIPFPE